MATDWNLHSCLCKVKFKKNEQGNLELVKWMEKCVLHKDVADGDLLSTLIAHDTQWNGQSGDIPELKKTECDRIKSLGDVLKNTD